MHKEKITQFLFYYSIFSCLVYILVRRYWQWAGTWLTVVGSSFSADTIEAIRAMLAAVTSSVVITVLNNGGKLSCREVCL